MTCSHTIEKNALRGDTQTPLEFSENNIEFSYLTNRRFSNRNLIGFGQTCGRVLLLSNSPASIWHQFGAARSNLGGFWLAWARFFVDLDEIFGQIFEWVEHGFGEQSLNERYGLIAALNIRFLHSLGCFPLPSGAAGCASRIRRLPNGECTAC